MIQLYSIFSTKSNLISEFFSYYIYFLIYLSIFIENDLNDTNIDFLNQVYCLCFFYKLNKVCDNKQFDSTMCIAQIEYKN